MPASESADSMREGKSMHILVASLLLGALAGGAEPPAAPDREAPQRQLVLELAAHKTTFVLYEPVTVTARVKNPTAQPIKAYLYLDMALEMIEFSIIGPDGKTTKFRGRVTGDALLIEEVLGPGEIVASDANLSWSSTGSVFTAPGEYEIRARLLVTLRPDLVYLESNPLRIKIEDPSKVDADAIAFFESPETLDSLLRDGLLGYCRGRVEPDCMNEIRRFLEANGGSAYAPRVAVHLASVTKSGQLSGTLHLEAAIALYRQFLKTWPSHADAVKILYMLARSLDEAGRLSEAAEAIREYEKTFPEYRQRTKSLRLELKAGKMLESSGR